MKNTYTTPLWDLTYISFVLIVPQAYFRFYSGTVRSRTVPLGTVEAEKNE